ncbi:MAG: SPOR domain-containing protein [Endozoicomonas sp.]
MLKGLIQRLLGALVLIGLLIFLAPAIFTGGQDHPMVKASLEPLTPSPQPPSFFGVLDVPAEAVEVREFEQEPESEQDTSPGVDSEGHLKAWSLQLASFSVRDNALKLVSDLKAMGHTAYIREVYGKNNQRLYRVLIGPEVRTEELQELKAKMQAELELTGDIVRFEP